MSSQGPVIFVDDEPHVRTAARQTLELAGYEVVEFSSAEPAVRHVTRDWPGIVVSDIRMPRMDGMELLRRCVELDPDVPVVLVTGHGDISTAVQAIRDGAYEFLEKPFRSELLVDVVKRAMEKRTLVLENRELRSELEAHEDPGAAIIGRSPAIEQLRATIENVADTDADVLILGETGTGKELVARCLHQQSRRQQHRFVAINCGAVPESIIESELFGHEAGAFTGANSRRIGKFEYADGGTVFLDEIESMPLPLQVKILRVLQERVVERLGSNECIPVDIRVVAATKTDLKALSARGEFREDLYYRLHVLGLEIPPLRERREDVPLLFQHFLLRAAVRYRRDPPLLTRELTQQLMSRAWEGNVRELQNCADRLLLSGPLGGLAAACADEPAGSAEPASLPEQVESFEKSIIAQELRNQKGNVKATHEALRVPRKTLYEKMRKYGLSRQDYLDREDGGD